MGDGVSGEVRLAPWRKIVETKRSDGYAPSYDGRYVTQTTPSKPGVRIVDTTTRQAKLTHTPAPSPGIEWAIDNVWFAGSWVVIEESALDGKAPVRGYRYDLRTGAKKDIGERAGMPSPTNFVGWSVRGGQLTYASGSNTKGSCLVVVQLDTLKWAKRHCVPAKSVIDRTEIGADGTAVFKVETWKDLKFMELPCAKLYRVALNATTAPPEPLAQRKDCEGFSGAAGKDWAVWSESAVNSETPDLSRGFARAKSGPPVPLGQIRTGSIVPCGDSVYWVVAMGGADNIQEALVARWRPGGNVELVFRGSEGSVVAKPLCANDRLTVTEDNSNTGTVTTFTLA